MSDEVQAVPAVEGEAAAPVEAVKEPAVVEAPAVVAHRAHSVLDSIEADFVKFYDDFKQRISDIRAHL